MNTYANFQRKGRGEFFFYRKRFIREKFNIHSTNDGHKVFAVTPQVPFQQRGRSCKLDVFWELSTFVFTSAHLWTTSGTTHYSKSLSDTFLKKIKVYGHLGIETVTGADIPGQTNGICDVFIFHFRCRFLICFKSQPWFLVLRPLQGTEHISFDFLGSFWSRLRI